MLTLGSSGFGRHRRALATLALGLGMAVTQRAAAQGTIKVPGDHPDYVFEAEPHLAASYGAGFGPGFRGTIAIVDKAFIPKLNNSIGIGVGAEWLFYSRHCAGPANARVCDSVGEVMVPVVLQWNFWVSRQFSVFGEPGIALHFYRGYHADHGDFALDPFTIFGGVRIHFSPSVALTLRLGAPELFHYDSVISIGVSFLI